MSERQHWLTLTQEDVLEPALAICDPHHHLWNHPGSRYLADDFLQDLNGGHQIVSTVFVECLQFYRTTGPEELKPVGETEFVESVAGKHPSSSMKTDLAAGIIGFADLTLGAAVEPVLSAHMAASSRFRGIRHATAWDASEQVHNAHTKPSPHLMQDPQFRAGLSCLARLGLSFDAWLFQPQIDELLSMAKALPDLTIVLDHMAGPLGIGPYANRRDEIFAHWHQDLVALAECSNVSVKLGGRTMTSAGFAWHKRDRPVGSAELAESIGPYYQACIELFGVDRCMFESNFPVDRASCSYTVLWNAFKRLTASYSADERNALFHDTATRVYRLESSAE